MTLSLSDVHHANLPTCLFMTVLSSIDDLICISPSFLSAEADVVQIDRSAPSDHIELACNLLNHVYIGKLYIIYI